jgi:hypothetical protein
MTKLPKALDSSGIRRIRILYTVVAGSEIIERRETAKAVSGTLAPPAFLQLLAGAGTGQIHSHWTSSSKEIAILPPPVLRRSLAVPSGLPRRSKHGTGA